MKKILFLSILLISINNVISSEKFNQNLFNQRLDEAVKTYQSFDSNERYKLSRFLKNVYNTAKLEQKLENEKTAAYKRYLKATHPSEKENLYDEYKKYIPALGAKGYGEKALEIFPLHNQYGELLKALPTKPRNVRSFALNLIKLAKVFSGPRTNIEDIQKEINVKEFDGNVKKLISEYAEEKEKGVTLDEALFMIAQHLGINL